MSRFRSLFANTDAPVMWAGLVVGLVCALGAAGLCSLINPHVVPLGLIIAGMLGLVAASAPMFMALRLVLLIGLLMLVSSVLAMAVRDHPVTAALTMAAVAMVTSVWTALPVVGRIFSSLPTLVFVMLLAKGQEFTGAASTLEVGLAVLAAVAVPMVVAVLLSVRDPRKYDREMAAAMWAGDTDAAKLGTFSRVLLLDGAPPPLLYLAAHGMLGRVCERWLHSRDADSPALPVGQANAGLIAKALLPRGPLQPRPVEITQLPTTPGATRLATRPTRRRSRSRCGRPPSIAGSGCSLANRCTGWCCGRCCYWPVRCCGRCCDRCLGLPLRRPARAGARRGRGGAGGSAQR